jgi:putative Mn2+ efflux pump MntP
MDVISTVILACGLSMDALAVSICSSLALDEIKWKHALTFGLFFGIFQAGMPLIGWLAGIGFRSLIKDIDHWIAFGLLLLIGGKMVVESFKKECRTKPNPLSLHVLLGLSVATSIDALAAGVSFGFLNLNIFTVITIIGVITFTLSTLGARIGKRLGCHFGERVELLGGIILVGIGTKILIQHLVNHI